MVIPVIRIRIPFFFLLCSSPSLSYTLLHNYIVWFTFIMEDYTVTGDSIFIHID